MMKRLYATALLTMVAMASHALAQSATDTAPRSAAGDRSSSASDATGAGTNRSPNAGQPSRTTQSSQGRTTTEVQSDTANSGLATQQRGQAGQGSQSDALNQHIAVCLTLGNQEEVALGQFAQERAQDPEVKQFAQMMVQEHQQAVAKLQQAAPQVASMNLQLSGQGGNASGGARNANATNQTTSANAANQRTTASGAAGGQHDQMVQLAREVKQKCLELTTADLGQKQGAEFDKCYIGQQLVAHTQMLAHLQAFQQHASAELRPIIQEGTQMTEHHIAQAKQIMEQLNAADAGGAQGQPQSATPRQPRS